MALWPGPLVGSLISGLFAQQAEAEWTPLAPTTLVPTTEDEIAWLRRRVREVLWQP